MTGATVNLTALELVGFVYLGSAVAFAVAGLLALIPRRWSVRMIRLIRKMERRAACARPTRSSVR